MTSLSDKAQDSIPVVRAAKATGQMYRLKDDSLVSADEIGDDRFPQYGDFATVAAIDANGSELGPRYLECPPSLANALLEAGIAVDDSFVIESINEASDGVAQFEVSQQDL